MAALDYCLRMRATLEPRGPAAAIVLTDEQVGALGAGKTPAVRVTANGISVAARVGRMGGNTWLDSARSCVPILG